jgi:Protein of unknown function (DUF4238)
MSRPIPKRHHFVPEMLQKRFVNSEGGLWFLDKRHSEGIIASMPGNIFVEGHLYTAVESDGTKDVSLELFYSNLESEADPILEKIVESARRRAVPRLSVEERSVWHEFFHYQFKRVPDFFRKLNYIRKFPDRINDAIDRFEQLAGRVVTEEERAELNRPEVVKRLKQNAIVHSLGDYGPLVKGALVEKGIAVAVIPKPSKTFVLGSSPIIRFNQAPGGSMNDPQVEMWLPIAHDVAVAPFGAPSNEHIEEVDDAAIRKVNRVIFQQSTVVASSSRALLESLARAR